MDPERIAQLTKQFAARPKTPDLNPAVESAVIRQYKELPPVRKAIIKVAIQHPCPYCEKEFGLSQTGKSHGICLRHLAESYKAMGKPVPQREGNTVDLATLTPEERKLLPYLFKIVKTRQTAKGSY